MRNILMKLGKLKSHNPELVRMALDLPRRVRVKRTKETDTKGIIVFGKKAKIIYLNWYFIY